MDWVGIYYLILLPLAGGYLIGSIPFGLILTHVSGMGDIRKIGSGNIGATNVLRTGNKKLAALTLLLDATKAALPVMILFGSLTEKSKGSEHFDGSFIHYYALMIGFGAVLGHCFPIWLKFKGGKGVATTLGALLAAVPYGGLAACITWLMMAFIFRISSLSALIAVAIAPAVTLFVYGQTPAFICLLITVLVWARHKDNIKRLIKGVEPKIGTKKEKLHPDDNQDP